MMRVVLTNREGAALRVFQVPDGSKSRGTRAEMRRHASEMYGKPWGRLHERGYRITVLAGACR